MKRRPLQAISRRWMSLALFALIVFGVIVALATRR